MGTNLSTKPWRGLIVQQDIFPQEPLVGVVRLPYTAKFTVSFKGIRYLLTDPRPTPAISSLLGSANYPKGDPLGNDNVGEGHHLESYQGDHFKYRNQNLYLPRLRNSCLSNQPGPSSSYLHQVQEERDQACLSPKAKKVMDSSNHRVLGYKELKRSRGKVHQLLKGQRPGPEHYRHNARILQLAKQAQQEKASRRHSRDDQARQECEGNDREVSTSDINNNEATEGTCSKGVEN